MTERCRWANPNNPLYIRYHDEEWGRSVHDDAILLELLILESFQAGLSWECVLNKREAFRKAFDGFDRDKILAYSEQDIERLMADPRIIRNRAKIKAAITNTKIFKAIQDEFGTFDRYLSIFCPENPILDHTSTTSSISDRLSADLRGRGMKFLGSTTIHAFLQSIGIFNSHHPDCFLYPGNSFKFTQMNIIKIERFHNYDALADLWLASVKATHDFISDSDIDFYYHKIPTEYMPCVEIHAIKNGSGEWIAFIGLSDDNIEMLFVHPAEMGKGYGTSLLEFAIDEKGIRKVDVNEQNKKALNFYKKHGFSIIGRDATDGEGKPYPILHLKLDD